MSRKRGTRQGTKIPHLLTRVVAIEEATGLPIKAAILDVLNRNGGIRPAARELEQVAGITLHNVTLWTWVRTLGLKAEWQDTAARERRRREAARSANAASGSADGY